MPDCSTIQCGMHAFIFRTGIGYSRYNAPPSGVGQPACMKDARSGKKTQRWDVICRLYERRVVVVHHCSRHNNHLLVHRRSYSHRYRCPLHTRRLPILCLRPLSHTHYAQWHQKHFVLVRPIHPVEPNKKCGRTPHKRVRLRQACRYKSSTRGQTKHEPRQPGDGVSSPASSEKHGTRSLLGNCSEEGAGDGGIRALRESPHHREVFSITQREPKHAKDCR